MELSHFRPEMGQFGMCGSPHAMSSTAVRATTPIPQNGTVHFRGCPLASAPVMFGKAS